MDFIYWAHKTPVGIKVEEIGDETPQISKIWKEMALQIYCEHGKENFREIGHFQDGAPFIFGLPARISITHTGGLLAVAMLPKTPDIELAIFNPRTAMGIDAERLDREQVLKIREKFLSEEELEFIPKDDLKSHIIAWTAKEAIYKAALTPGLDFRKDITINSLPEIDASPEIVDGKDALKIGVATLTLREAGDNAGVHEMKLYSYESFGCCLTIAYSPKCAKFAKSVL